MCYPLDPPEFGCMFLPDPKARETRNLASSFEVPMSSIPHTSQLDTRFPLSPPRGAILISLLMLVVVSLPFALALVLGLLASS